MLKDNHIWSTGSISESVHKARSACGFATKIEARREAGLKDPVAERPNHSDLCTSEFRYNSVRIQKKLVKIPQKFWKFWDFSTFSTTKNDYFCRNLKKVRIAEYCLAILKNQCYFTRFFLLVPSDNCQKELTCPTAFCTCPGQSDKRYCRAL